MSSRWETQTPIGDSFSASVQDEDLFNGILWHATRGGAQYPEEYMGRQAPGGEDVRA
jgi:hypothetical protein